jgi:hypothetical protein
MTLYKYAHARKYMIAAAQNIRNNIQRLTVSISDMKRSWLIRRMDNSVGT